MNKGAGLLVKTVKAVESGRYQEHPQESFEVTEQKHAPKLTKETGLIDFIQPVENVYNLIRGLSPTPAAYTTLNGKILKIYKATKEEKKPGIQPGGFLTDSKTYLKFACLDGFVSVTDVQLEGKNALALRNFYGGRIYNSYKIQPSRQLRGTKQSRLVESPSSCRGLLRTSQ
jgi:methionyl-tRNA formyltransferase